MSFFKIQKADIKVWYRHIIGKGQQQEVEMIDFYCIYWGGVIWAKF